MRKTKTITAILCSLALLVGCGQSAGTANTETTSVVTNPATEVETTSSENQNRIEKEEMEDGETSLPEEEYHQNADGTWSYKGKTYQNRLMLTGKLPNAVGESFYIVLSNDQDVSYEEISHRLLSSTFIPGTDDSPAVVNMGVYDDLCKVESASVLVSASYITPYGLTVLFDQYDNQIPEELLTGEHFALDRWTGEGWDPMDTVISDYGFTDIGYPLKKGGMTRKVFNWDWLYGKLEPGRYRIRVQVIDSEVHEAAAVFMISSGDTGAAIDVRDSGLYSEQDRLDAAAVILEEFSGWEGCELHQLWFTFDEQNNAENIKWMNELAEGQGLHQSFTECMQFKSNYHSPVDPDKAGGWEPDKEYTDWEWWLARTEGGEWHLMTWGY